MIEFMVVGIGGFIGSCLRFAITRLVGVYGERFPFGTLLSNVIAGMLIGFVIGIEQQTSPLEAKAKLFLTTGLMGGLSTFSAFSLETVGLFQGGKYVLGCGNVLLNLGLSLLGVVAGMFLAKVIFAKR